MTAGPSGSPDRTPPAGMRLAQQYASAGPAHGAIGWSPDGGLLAGALLGGAIAIWAPGERAPLHILAGRPAAVQGLAWSPDSTALASGDDRAGVFVWDVASRDLKRVLKGARGVVSGIAWHPKDPLVAANDLLGWTRIWDAETGAGYHDLRHGARGSRATAVAWSPDGGALSVGGSPRFLSLWDAHAMKERWQAEGITAAVSDIAWSPDGRLIAAGLDAPSVLIYDALSGMLRQTLEGFLDSVTSVSFSADGRALAIIDARGRLRIWHTHDWSAGATMQLARSKPRVAFHPRRSLLASLDGTACVWELESEASVAVKASRRTVRVTSAKIVLVGETNSGKSCLASRLSEGRYPRDEELGTTHGMRFWPTPAGAIHRTAAAPDGERRDVVLWDFGGQHEYRLVHQLFLHDTTLALVLFDPTRGSTERDHVRDWNARLDRQLTGRRAVKILVGAKQDEPSTLVDVAAIEALRQECGFVAYHEVSARTNRNIRELREALAAALDWEALATTSRPELFQLVRDYIEEQRTAGRIVLRVSDLTRVMTGRRPDLSDDAEIAAAAAQLAVQGLIAQTTLTEGAAALVLQVPVIERYAASLIVAARSNPRGVPALEERLLGSPELPLPGMTEQERLPRVDERVVLECVAELMIRHGLCVRHAGLLVFPSLFPATSHDVDAIAHSVSLYYDFTGPIDNIYASLVARLMISDEFGKGRLYPQRLELDAPDAGVCGIRQIVRDGGLAHLDLYFSEATRSDRRALFSRFVADHLREHGVAIREHQAIKCRGCGREIPEDVVQDDLRKGHRDVQCFCRTHTLISDAVEGRRGTDVVAERRIVALRAEVDARTKDDTERAKAAVGGRHDDSRADEPLRVLHLSDLHFTADTQPETTVQWLLQDLRGGDLGKPSIEYLVISGDITDRGTVEGLAHGVRFVELLTEELGISAERCIFVPGNHDVRDVEAAYDYYASEARARAAQPNPELWHREGRAIFVRNDDHYPSRLEDFSKQFFHMIIQRAYPLDYREQGEAYLFPRTGIQFLTLNSGWQIDHFHRDRASVHPASVAHAIKVADAQVRAAIDEHRMAADAPLLRIGVWHHALQHPEMLRGVDFADNLQTAGVRVALHGDIHELNRECFRSWHRNAMHLVGAGSFGSPASGRPESIPRLYGLLEIDRGLGSMRVHTRRQLKPESSWGGWNEWPPPDGGPGGVPYYRVDL